MLGVRPHVPLKIADVPATIGHEGDLTVHPDALLQQQFMKATTRPVVMSDHEAEPARRSEEHTSELQSLMRISYAVFCLKKKNKLRKQHNSHRKTYAILMNNNLTPHI